MTLLDHTALLRLLPEGSVGVVERIEPITLRLSGARRGRLRLTAWQVTGCRGRCLGRP